MLRALGSVSCDIIHETESYDFLRALGSSPCDITYETGRTVCYGLWVLRLVISRTRQGVHNCYGHWGLRLVTSHTTQGVRFIPGIRFFVLSYRRREILGSAS